jgi:hypothetical protein
VVISRETVTVFTAIGVLEAQSTDHNRNQEREASDYVRGSTIGEFVNA